MAGLHGAALAMMVGGATASMPPSPPQAMITVELAPLQQPPVPAARQEAKPQAKPKPPREARAVPPRPRPLPAVTPPAESVALRMPAPPSWQPAEPPAEEAARQTPPLPAQSVAIPTWQGELLAHLEQHKQYPRSARLRRQEGVVVVRFVMDREGHVLSARLERPSGAGPLDEEGLALLDRAQPLPAPPDSIAGNHLELVVPVQFTLR